MSLSEELETPVSDIKIEIQRCLLLKDDVRQRLTIVKLGLQNQRDDLRETQARHKADLMLDKARILRETDFKEKNITNKEGRDGYVSEKQRIMIQNQRDEIDDIKETLAQSEVREMELKDEYIYYKDRFDFLMKVYDIEGEIDLPDDLLSKREKIKGD